MSAPFYFPAATVTGATGSKLLTFSADADIRFLKPDAKVYLGSRDAQSGPGFIIESVAPTGAAGGTAQIRGGGLPALPTFWGLASYAAVPFVIETSDPAADSLSYFNAQLASITSAYLALTGRRTTLDGNAREIWLDKQAAASAGRLGFSQSGATFFQIDQRRVTIGGVPNVEVLSIDWSPDGAAINSTLMIRRDNGAVIWGAGLTNTYTGDVTISKVSPSLILSNLASGQARTIKGQTNGVDRWFLELGTTDAESGGNVGSNFALRSRTDFGAALRDNLIINRATGAWAIGGALAITGAFGATSGAFSGVVTIDIGAGSAAGLITKSSVNSSIDFWSGGAAAGSNRGKLMYAATGLTAPGFLMQSVDDAGAFVANRQIFWKAGGIDAAGPLTATTGGFSSNVTISPGTLIISASGATDNGIALRSGASNARTGLGIGRTAIEGGMFVVGNAAEYATGTVAGDFFIGGVSSGNLFIGTAGTGTIARFNVPPVPNVDNGYTLGTSSFRWSQLYAATTTINTSAEADKDNFKPVRDDLLRAAISTPMVEFQFRDAIKRKGANGARWHVGPTAEGFFAACKKFNIDPYGTAVYCEDPEIVEEIERRATTVPMTKTITVDEERIEIRNGKAYRTIETVELQEPVFEEVDLFEGRKKTPIGKHRVQVMKEETAEFVVRKDTGNKIKGLRLTLFYALRQEAVRRIQDGSLTID